MAKRRGVYQRRVKQPLQIESHSDGKGALALAAKPKKAKGFKKTGFGGSFEANKIPDISVGGGADNL